MIDHFRWTLEHVALEEISKVGKGIRLNQELIKNPSELSSKATVRRRKMKTNEKVGSVAGIWLFPVKSMQGQRLGSGEFTERGLVGDRAYAIIDSETGKVASAKSVRLFPELFKCKAAFVEPPRLNSELPPVQITLPDGATVNSDSGDVDNVLSEFFGREVTLASIGK